jgi:hypothetical protein
MILLFLVSASLFAESVSCAYCFLAQIIYEPRMGIWRLEFSTAILLALLGVAGMIMAIRGITKEWRVP